MATRLTRFLHRLAKKKSAADVCAYIENFLPELSLLLDEPPPLDAFAPPTVGPSLAARLTALLERYGDSEPVRISVLRLVTALAARQREEAEWQAIVGRRWTGRPVVVVDRSVRDAAQGPVPVGGWGMAVTETVREGAGTAAVISVEVQHLNQRWWYGANALRPKYAPSPTYTRDLLQTTSPGFSQLWEALLQPVGLMAAPVAAALCRFLCYLPWDRLPAEAAQASRHVFGLWAAFSSNAAVIPDVLAAMAALSVPPPAAKRVTLFAFRHSKRRTLALFTTMREDRQEDTSYHFEHSFDVFDRHVEGTVEYFVSELASDDADGGTRYRVATSPAEPPFVTKLHFFAFPEPPPFLDPGQPCHYGAVKGAPLFYGVPTDSEAPTPKDLEQIDMMQRFNGPSRADADQWASASATALSSAAADAIKRFKTHTEEASGGGEGGAAASGAEGADSDSPAVTKEQCLQESRAEAWRSAVGCLRALSVLIGCGSRLDISPTTRWAALSALVQAAQALTSVLAGARSADTETLGGDMINDAGQASRVAPASEGGDAPAVCARRCGQRMGGPVFGERCGQGEKATPCAQCAWLRSDKLCAAAIGKVLEAVEPLVSATGVTGLSDPDEFMADLLSTTLASGALKDKELSLMPPLQRVLRVWSGQELLARVFQRAVEGAHNADSAVSGAPMELNCSNWFVGARVVRSARWKYRNQDGGPGNQGTVTGADNDRWVKVRWDQGGSNSYEYGVGESTLNFATGPSAKISALTDLSELLAGLGEAESSPSDADGGVVAEAQPPLAVVQLMIRGLTLFVSSFVPKPFVGKTSREDIACAVCGVMEGVFEILGAVCRGVKDRDKVQEILTEIGRVTGQLLVAVEPVANMVAAWACDDRLAGLERKPLLRVLCRVTLQDSTFQRQVRMCLLQLADDAHRATVSAQIEAIRASARDPMELLVRAAQLLSKLRQQTAMPQTRLEFLAQQNPVSKKTIEDALDRFFTRFLRNRDYRGRQIRLRSGRISFADDDGAKALSVLVWKTAFVVYERLLANPRRIHCEALPEIADELFGEACPAFATALKAALQQDPSPAKVREFLTSTLAVSRSAIGNPVVRDWVEVCGTVVEGVAHAVVMRLDQAAVRPRRCTLVETEEAIEGCAAATAVLEAYDRAADWRAMLCTELLADGGAMGSLRSLIEAAVLSMAAMCRQVATADGVLGVFDTLLLQTPGQDIHADVFAALDDTTPGLAAKLLVAAARLREILRACNDLRMSTLGDCILDTLSARVGTDVASAMAMQAGPRCSAITGTLSTWALVARLVGFPSTIGELVVRDLTEVGALDAVRYATRAAVAHRDKAALADLGLLVARQAGYEKFFATPVPITDAVLAGLRESATEQLEEAVLGINLEHAAELTEAMGSIYGRLTALVASGLPGWFLLQPTSLGVNGLPCFEVTASETLAVRRSPSLHSDLIGGLPTGTVFAVHETVVLGKLRRHRIGPGAWVGPLGGLATAVPEAEPPVVAPLAPGVLPQGRWSCPHCTFVNAHGADCCVMCGLQPGANATTWTCSVCTFSGTSVDAASCEVCGQARPGAAMDERGSCQSEACPMKSDPAPCVKYAAHALSGGASCTYCGCPASAHRVIDPDAVELSEEQRRHLLCPRNPIAGVARSLALAFEAFATERLSGPGAHSLGVHVVSHVNALLDTTSELCVPDLDSLNASLQQLARLLRFVSGTQDMADQLLASLTARLFRRRSLGLPHEEAVVSSLGCPLGKQFRRRVRDMLSDVRFSGLLSEAVSPLPAFGGAVLSVVLATAQTWPISAQILQWKVPLPLRPFTTAVEGTCADPDLLTRPAFAHSSFYDKQQLNVLVLQESREPQGGADTAAEDAGGAALGLRDHQDSDSDDDGGFSSELPMTGLFDEPEECWACQVLRRERVHTCICGQTLGDADGEGGGEVAAVEGALEPAPGLASKPRSGVLVVWALTKVHAICSAVAEAVGARSAVAVQNGRMLNMASSIRDRPLPESDTLLLVVPSQRAPLDPAPLRLHLMASVRDAIIGGQIQAPGYLSSRTGVHLTWLPEGTAEVYSAEHRCTLAVSTPQMCVLLALNDQPRLSFGALLAATGLTDLDLRAALLALTAHQHPVLRCTAAAGSRRRARGIYCDTDGFEVNLGFRPELKAGKPAAAAGAEPAVVPIRRTVAPEGLRAARRRFAASNHERVAYIDAVIVRTLKRAYCIGQRRLRKQNAELAVKAAAEAQMLPDLQACTACHISKPEEKFSRTQWALYASPQGRKFPRCLDCIAHRRHPVRHPPDLVPGVVERLIGGVVRRIRVPIPEGEASPDEQAGSQLARPIKPGRAGSLDLDELKAEVRRLCRPRMCVPLRQIERRIRKLVSEGLLESDNPHSVVFSPDPHVVGLLDDEPGEPGELGPAEAERAERAALAANSVDNAVAAGQAPPSTARPPRLVRPALPSPAIVIEGTRERVASTSIESRTRHGLTPRPASAPVLGGGGNPFDAAFVVANQQRSGVARQLSVGSPQVSPSPLLRLQSQSTRLPPEVLLLAGSVEESGHQRQQAQPLLATADQAVFVTKEHVMRQLQNELTTIAERLGVTHSQALGLLSTPAVSWCARLAYDHYYNVFLPEKQLRAASQEGEMVSASGDDAPSVCCMELAGTCPFDDEEGVDDFYTLPCGHKVHRSCLKEKLETGALGFAATGNDGERGTTAVIGATCPAMDMFGKFICNEPIPWVRLFEERFFGEQTEAAKAIWKTDVLNKCLQESPTLQLCSGGCETVAVSDIPFTNATNTVTCSTCKTSFCFKCKGHWFEDHRPATCLQMAQWGESLPGGAAVGSGGESADTDTLSRMYIFQNTVKCPRCQNRVQKISGCIHLTCGASDYGGSDWRGRGCGLGFCEQCESPLAESKCPHSRCNRPEKKKRLEAAREELRGRYGAFQKHYVPRALRALVSGVEPHGVLVTALAQLLLRAQQARAHAVVFFALTRLSKREEASLTAWCEQLERAMEPAANLVGALCKTAPFVDQVMASYSTLHPEHMLRHEHAPRVTVCSMCPKPTVHMCGECAFALCRDCWLKSLDSDRVEVRLEDYHTLSAALAGFLAAFEQVTQPSQLDSGP